MTKEKSIIKRSGFFIEKEKLLLKSKDIKFALNKNNHKKIKVLSKIILLCLKKNKKKKINDKPNKKSEIFIPKISIPRIPKENTPSRKRR